MSPLGPSQADHNTITLNHSSCNTVLSHSLNLGISVPNILFYYCICQFLEEAEDGSPFKSLFDLYVSSKNLNLLTDIYKLGNYVKYIDFWSFVNNEETWQPQVCIPTG